LPGFHFVVLVKDFLKIISEVWFINNLSLVSLK